MTDQLVISEIFGPTFQGEGPDLGLRCGFVRLGRCSLACSWCDTPYSWDWSRHDPAQELREMSVDEIVARIEEMGVHSVVVTGGEPLLQQRRLVDLFAALHDLQYMTHIETAGTIAWEGRPSPKRWVVSPKLANSGMDEERRLRVDVLRDFASRFATFKFVVVETSDLDEIADIADRAAIPASSIWAMPEGTSPETIVTRTAALADAVLARGWNLTTRLHVLAWGDQRGR